MDLKAHVHNGAVDAMKFDVMFFGETTWGEKFVNYFKLSSEQRLALFFEVLGQENILEKIALIQLCWGLCECSQEEIDPSGHVTHLRMLRKLIHLALDPDEFVASEALSGIANFFDNEEKAAKYLKEQRIRSSLTMLKNKYPDNSDIQITAEVLTQHQESSAA